jgi:outer membrane receptor for ferrienterochelin and colicins
VDTTAAPDVGQERYHRKYDTLSGGLTMTYSKSKHNWRTDLSRENQDVMTDDRSRTSGDFDTLALESAYTYYGDQHWITLGGEARRDTADLMTTRNGADEFGVKATIRNYALFVQDEIRLFDDRLTVIPGARGENHSRYGNSINPKLSAMYLLAEGTHLRASIGRAFKSPALGQLYMDRPRAHGTFEYLVSNPDLKPEVAWSANLGLEKRWHAVPLWGSVNLFESRVSDMIITVDTGREINGLPVRTYDNVDEVNVKGAELAFQIGRHRGLYLHGTAGLTRSVQEGGQYDGQYLTYVPRHQASLAPGYASATGRWGTQLTWTHVGRQYRDQTNENEIKAHQVVDAGAWLMLSTGRNVARLSLNVSNLTDSDKGEDQPNRYRTGRGIKLSLSGRF